MAQKWPSFDHKWPNFGHLKIFPALYTIIFSKKTTRVVSKPKIRKIYSGVWKIKAIIIKILLNIFMFLECLYTKVLYSRDINSFLFNIIFGICIFSKPRSFSSFTHLSREYFLWLVEKSICFCKELFSSLVTWAKYLRCWILQKDVMSEVFVTLSSF